MLFCAVPKNYWKTFLNRITQGKVSLAFSASLTLPCLHRDSEWLVPSVVRVIILHKNGHSARIKIDSLF